MTGIDAVLSAFDRLFDKAAARLRVYCNDQEKQEAKRNFAESFSAALGLAGPVTIPQIPEGVMQAMEEAIDRLSPAQVVAHLAATPLVYHAQEMLRLIASHSAQQKALAHLIEQADDTYGGN